MLAGAVAPRTRRGLGLAVTTAGNPTTPPHGRPQLLDRQSAGSMCVPPFRCRCCGLRWPLALIVFSSAFPGTRLPPISTTVPSCTLRHPSALLPKIFERPGPKSVPGEELFGRRGGRPVEVDGGHRGLLREGPALPSRGSRQLHLGCAAATRLIIDAQDGPVVLVGHSYGGAIITEAGTDQNVAALVYICGFVPDKDERSTRFSLVPTRGPSAADPAAPGRLLVPGPGRIPRIVRRRRARRPSRLHGRLAGPLGGGRTRPRRRSGSRRGNRHGGCPCFGPCLQVAVLSAARRPTRGRLPIRPVIEHDDARTVTIPREPAPGRVHLRPADLGASQGAATRAGKPVADVAPMLGVPDHHLVAVDPARRAGVMRPARTGRPGPSGPGTKA